MFVTQSWVNSHSMLRIPGFPQVCAVLGAGVELELAFRELGDREWRFARL